jgi:bacterioferritin-associated ferredoxin
VYICICNAVKESDIRDAVNNGVACFKTLSRTLGLSTDCGSCGKKAMQAFHNALSQAETHTNVIPIDIMSAEPARRAP